MESIKKTLDKEIRKLLASDQKTWKQKSYFSLLWSRKEESEIYMYNPATGFRPALWREDGCSLKEARDLIEQIKKYLEKEYKFEVYDMPLKHFGWVNMIEIDPSAHSF